MYEQVRDALIDVLSEIQDINGQPVPNIDDETCPMRDLPGFDSLNSVEAVVMLSGKLGYDIPIRETFFPKKGKPFSIREIVQKVIKTMERGGTQWLIPI